MKKFLITALAIAAIIPAGAYEYFLESGNYRIMISEKYKHTIRKIQWKGFTAGTPNGYYGAIIAPKSGKFIGAGHTQGGMEQLLSFTVTCDGKKVTPADKMVFKGKKITVEKLSMFDKLLFSVRLELTPEGLVETKRFTAAAEQQIHSFYSHIFCFNKSFTDYYALTDKGEIISGKFSMPKLKRAPQERKERKTQWHIRSTVKYAAEYDAAAKKGVLLYYPEIIKGKEKKSTIWEVPWGYMKYYMITWLPDVIPAGWNSPEYTVILRCFDAAGVEDLPQTVRQEADAAAKITFSPAAKPQ